MQVVENAIVIDRPAADVFDYCSDLRTEADWNPVCASVTPLSAWPVTLGSRYRGSWIGLGTSELEVVTFERPRTWTTRTTAATLPFRVIGTVEEHTSGSSRLTMRIELEPVGFMARLGPVIRLSMGPTARANLKRIKTTLEGHVTAR